MQTKILTLLGTQTPQLKAALSQMASSLILVIVMTAVTLSILLQWKPAMVLTTIVPAMSPMPVIKPSGTQILMGDGYGDDEATTLENCTQPIGYVDNTDDCNDLEPFARTGAIDFCDGIDNDCSGDEVGCIDSDFYLDTNGVTVKCPNAAVGDTGVVNGVQYTKRDRVEMEFLVLNSIKI